MSESYGGSNPSVSANSKQTRKAQLGMDYSTASARLRRIATWELLSETGRTGCFRCRLPMTVDNYSIDHRVDWLHGNPDLFWDTDNLTWSHLRCNSLSGRKTGGARRKAGPIGTAWCAAHAAFLPESDFYRNSNRWNGFGSECKSCRRKYDLRPRGRIKPRGEPHAAR